jgi:hypothetical protein
MLNSGIFFSMVEFFLQALEDPLYHEEEEEEEEEEFSLGYQQSCAN